MEQDYSKFKKMWDSWVEVLICDDGNSINNQISTMLWDAGAFYVVNEARKMAPIGADGTVQQNQLIHDLINRCFFASQIMAIRRLTDSSSLGGPKGVYSITSLLKNLKENYKIITRENLSRAFDWHDQDFHAMFNEWAELPR
jgi:hypothetical protein